MFFNEDEFEDVRKQSEDRIRRKRKRAGKHDTRVLILALLAKDDGQCLSAGQIRARLPGPRRPQQLINYHLRVLLADGFVQTCRGPDAFEAR